MEKRISIGIDKALKRPFKFKYKDKYYETMPIDIYFGDYGNEKEKWILITFNLIEQRREVFIMDYINTLGGDSN